MHNFKRIFFTILVTCAFFSTKAQEIMDNSSQLNFLQDCMVKTLEEFTQRFNGDEIPQYIKNNPDIPPNRHSYIQALFDRDYFANSDSSNLLMVEDFIRLIITEDIKVSMFDSNFYCVAHCLFDNHGKSIQLDLILQLENIRNQFYKWVVVGVNGLHEAGLIPSQKYGYITPNQHDFHFDELNSVFPHLFNYCYRSMMIDQLSVLIALCEQKIVTYKSCGSNDYYFFQVPNYVFQVSERRRIDSNSGWLISNISKLDGKGKQILIESLCGRINEKNTSME